MTGHVSRSLVPRTVRGLVTLPFCLCAVLAVPVVVFGPLPVPLSSLTLSE